ncbi:MAG TPA: hypothetical protein VF794_12120 [Archangium sp.]|jgi:hypothetical protein|uniref:hypothetical protein n=1 Tax=Archangium sp. TaxID=1872627 RepID=UPI002ED8A9A5
MHRESGVHTTRPWKRVLPAALLALAVGCGEAEPQGSDPVPVAVATESPVAMPSMKPAPQAPSWFHRLGGPQDDLGTGLAVDGRGDISVVWLSTPRMDEDREAVPGERRALTLAKYGRDGEVRWTREFSGMRLASPRVGASPSGDVFLTANAFLYPEDFGLGEANDGFLVKFSSDGQPLWQRRVGQKVHGLAADGEGGALVAAEEWTPDGHVPVLAHHDAQGAYLWTRQLDPVAEGTELHALALMPSGQALLAGRLVGTLRVDGQDFGAPGGRGLLLLAFERDGRLAWGRQVRGVEGHVTGLKPGPDGSVALVGDFRGTLPWGGTTLSGSGAFVLATGPDGAERWAHPLACGARPTPPVVTVDDAGQVVAGCGGELSVYAPEGAQRDQRTLTPGECTAGDCLVASTALDFVPGQGLTLAGYQRHDGGRAGEAWNQEAFLRVLAP